MQNFASSIAEAQIDVSSAAQDGTMARLDLFFTLFFTAELALNAASHWFERFASNWWNW